MPTSIPSEAIGSIPRPANLVEALLAPPGKALPADALEALFDQAVRDTVQALEDTGSVIITDGEQRKISVFGSYALAGLNNLDANGFVIPYRDGQVRQLPRLLSGPFRFGFHASDFVRKVCHCTRLPVKQAVTSPSALSLIYPPEGIPDYPREAFIEDLIDEQAKDIRDCLLHGASRVQLDFIEGSLAMKLDPTGSILEAFIDLNNMVLDRFSDDERQRIGVHTCPGVELDSTHGARLDFAELLPSLLELRAGSFYVPLAAEKDPVHLLEVIQRHRKPQQFIFIGVIDVSDPRVETPEVVCERVLQAARYIPREYLGTTDDCGFAPFFDDLRVGRDTAFAKIRARIEGTALAEKRMQGR